jgi:hypothetical protein
LTINIRFFFITINIYSAGREIEYSDSQKYPG